MNNMDKIIDLSNITPDQMMDILKPLDGHDTEFLDVIAGVLKGQGGEQWAVGDLIQKAIKIASVEMVPRVAIHIDSDHSIPISLPEPETLK